MTDSAPDTPPTAGTELARWPRTQPLVRGTLIRRYKRFLADVELDSGEIVVAHCVNTGAMEGLARPGIPVWLSAASNPKRKLPWTWEMAELDGRVWGTNTSMPNRFIARLLEEKRLPWLAHWPSVRAEMKYGERSRVDFWLSEHEGAAGKSKTRPGGSLPCPSSPAPLGREHFLEVKNCHLVYPDHCAYFPDCVSARATQHLEELGRCIETGNGRITAEALFVVQVAGVQLLRPSDMHDPAFAKAARHAARQGVKFNAISVHHTPEEIIVTGPVPVDLNPYPLDKHEQWRAANLNRP